MADSEYRQAVVTYIDILGFREMVEESQRTASRIPELRGVLTALRSRIGTGRFFRRESPKNGMQVIHVEGYGNDHGTVNIQGRTPLFRAFSFSDLTVRVTVIDPADEFWHILVVELLTLVYEQCRLACRDNGNSPILLRGGITLGAVQVHPEVQEDELIFGPALVRAYELENTAAIFPRIVVDPEVIKRARSLPPFLYKQLISLSEDGIYFVDYLNVCESFTTHKHMVETRLAKLKAGGAREGVVQKYLWLVNYHNSKVNQLPDSILKGRPDAERNRDELYISEELLSLLK